MTEPVTFMDQYTSLLQLYKKMMFPPPNYIYGGAVARTGWTMSQIDEMDVHFFDDLLLLDEAPQSQEKDVYLAAIW